MMSAILPFDETPSLLYLGLPQAYQPSPKNAPIPFLTKHLTQLPPHLSLHFSYITNPKQRAAVPSIRNRRLKYAHNDPPELRFDSARSTWPTLWQGRERRGMEQGNEEKEWVESGFLQGSAKHVGNLGSLLGGYEEEREAERVRILRRERAVINDFLPEEDESDGEEYTPDSVADDETPEEAKATFERLVRERFIYGLLDVSPCLWTIG